MPQVLKGIIVRKKFQKSDNSWHLVVFKVMNGNVAGDDIEATGYIPWSPDDDLIELEGEFKQTKYGNTFVATQSWKVLPITTTGIKSYLVETVPGIGASKANALGKHFGSDLATILNNSPDKLSECPTITNKLAEAITKCWQQDGLARKVGMFLTAHDISLVWRERIIEKFGIYAIEKITNNPFILTTIRGIGFSKADEIAKKLGFKKDSAERIKACFTHTLTKAMEEGHCFLHEGDLKKDVMKLTKAKPEIVNDYLTKLIDSKQIVESVLKDKDVDIKVYYLAFLHEAEERVSEQIRSLLGPSKVKLTHRTLNDVQYSEQQTKGILSCFDNRLSVITGAPGTGKSTTIKGVVQLANRNGIAITLCAPTGRAAKRLGEITGEETATIHRMLKYDGKEKVFGHNKDNPVIHQMIIVDESSMIDIELASNLLDAVGPNTNIVFIGDTDQLPSVGPGAFLKDLIKSKKVNTTILDRIFRQAQQSLMVQNSHRIKNGEYPIFPPKGSSADSYAAIKSNSNMDDAVWAEEVVKQMVSTNIPKQMKALYNIDIDIKHDIQVLIPMKKGTFGVYEANRLLQKVFNPDGKSFLAHGKTWHVGDKVIQNVNNYELEVYNGDIGIIKGYDPIDKVIAIDYDGKIVNYDYKLAADSLALANAISIHKSQGSEYKVVVVVLLWQHHPMLERNLIYTANTRAKLMTLYVVAGGTIKKAVDTNKVKSRNSLLAHRIKKEDNKDDDIKTPNNPCKSLNGPKVFEQDKS